MKKITSLLLSLIMLITSIGVGFYAYAMDISYGVDVSEFNEGVDYSQDVQGKGKSFVMIRLGYGTAHLDKYFEENVKAAYDAGLDFGIYFYSYAYNTAEAQQEAEFVINTLKSMDSKYYEYFKLPVAFDLEDSKIADACSGSKAQITNIMTTFLDAIAAEGFVPMIYANQNWFLNYINLDTVVDKGYKIWYAYWTEKAPDTTTQIEIGNTGIKADMWQYKGVEIASPTVFDENLIYYTDELVQPIIRSSISRSSIVYTGTVQRPSVTVTFGAGKILEYKKDYTVSYSDWSSTNVGTYSVTVNYIGDYSGSQTFTYNIVPQTNVTPKLNRNTITYTGTVQRPQVTVTDAKGNQLVYNKDFKVSYSNINSKEVGRYTVTVTMMGNYSGRKTYPYYINPKGTTFLTSAQGGFKGVKNGFTLKWNKQTNNTTGYQIQYSTKSDFSNAATIYAGPSSATSKTVTGRASKTRYYVRIRTYKNVGGKYFYSDWSTGTKSVVTL